MNPVQRILTMLGHEIPKPVMPEGMAAILKRQERLLQKISLTDDDIAEIELKLIRNGYREK